MVLYPNKLPESERVCSGICKSLYKLSSYMIKSLLYVNRASFYSGQKENCQIRITVTLRAPCAPITSACSISAVFEGPEMNTP